MYVPVSITARGVKQVVSRLKKRPALVISTVALVVILSLVGWAAWQIQAMMNLNRDPDGEALQEIVIPYNSSTRQIAAILEDEGIIPSAFIFLLYVRYFSPEPGFQAGSYQMAPGTSFEDIIATLQEGVILQEGIRFTVPEGYTVEQIARRLDVEGIVSAEAFLEACEQYDDAERFLFLEDIPGETAYRLEGYLFPDTYEVFEETTAEEIVVLMLARLEKALHEGFVERLDEIELSLHQILTLASIVEKEARVAEERSLIAAVFHNRLESDHMPFLQSCATVQYALGEVKPFLTYRDLEVDSPYNTYRHPGLPPGPIASPGYHAIEATLFPAEVDYLYFVYKEDGSGTHYFSRTLEEHNEYKRKAQGNRN